MLKWLKRFFGRWKNKHKDPVAEPDPVVAVTVDDAEATTEGASTVLINATVSPPGGTTASSIGVYSDAITFTFDTSYTVGTYWNGDPWVNRGGGSVTITSISPVGLGDGAVAASTGADRVRNGAMLNWNTGAEADDSFANIYWGSEAQAFDSHQPTSASYLSYIDARQDDPTLSGASLVVSAEGAVLKAKSNIDADLGTGGAARGTVVADLGLLTIVDTSPPASAFRPGAHTLTKAHRWTIADVDHSLVPSGLTAPASTPSYAAALNKVERHHIMGSLHYDKLRVLMPQNHMMNYGQNNAAEIIDAVLTAMTDSVTTGERETLLNSVVQIGIDVYDRYNEGGRWHVNGGLYRGYKLPLVLAATLLDDAGMKTVAGINPTTGANVWDAFGDDRAIWYLTSSDTGRSLDVGHEEYLVADEGDPEWGEQHTYNASRDDRREDATYRDINTRGIVGAALACQMITGARANWNWQAHFDYADRIMERDFYASGETLTWGGTNFIANYSGSNPVPQFQKDMWSSFRASYGNAVWNR